jgi:hypothetical protein
MVVEMKDAKAAPVIPQFGIKIRLVTTVKIIKIATYHALSL